LDYRRFANFESVYSCDNLRICGSNLVGIKKVIEIVKRTF